MHWQLNSFPDPANHGVMVTKEVRYNDPDSKVPDSQILMIVPSKYPPGQGFELKLEELQMRLNTTKNEMLLQTFI